MLSIKKTASVGCLAVCMIYPFGAAQAEDKPVFRCPDTFDAAGKTFRLNNASVFDGAPKEKGGLVPESEENARRWEIDYRFDPYLVCRYEDSLHTITLHVKGTQACKVEEKPFSAYCE